MDKSNRNKSKRTPELEYVFMHNPSIGYEPDGSLGFVRFIEHGSPNALIRWHYHEEYELHLIVETSGKVFVGDYIGHFEPGHLVLTGPRLPHNWISKDIPKEGIGVRDRVLHFSGEPLLKASKLLPEFKEVIPLLEKAKHGIKFRGISNLAGISMSRIKETSGMERFIEFLSLLTKLSDHKDYQLLSSAQLQSFEDSASLKRMSEVIEYISENYATIFSMAEIADRMNMTEGQFSRYFKQATGNTFTNFVNHLRINHACQLLMETDQYISTICYAVGFNNVANFNRRFMTTKGMTPSEFRKQGEERYGV